MNATKVLVIVLAVFALLFAVSLGLALKPRDDDPGDTSDSRLTGLRDAIAGTKGLDIDHVRDADCFSGTASGFVVDAGGGCDIAIPGDVKQIELCVPDGSGAFSSIELDGDQFSPQLAEAVLVSCPEAVRFDVYDEDNVLSLACSVGGDRCALVFPSS